MITQIVALVCQPVRVAIKCLRCYYLKVNKIPTVPTAKKLYILTCCIKLHVLSFPLDFRYRVAVMHCTIFIRKTFLAGFQKLNIDGATGILSVWLIA